MEQYVAFDLGSSLFGIHIYYSLEINEISEYAQVPGGPEWINGLLNLRGEIVTIFNLKHCLGFKDEGNRKEKKNIILKIDDEIDPGLWENGDPVSLGNDRIGFSVENVRGIIEVDRISPVPPVNRKLYNVEYLQGVFEMKEELMMLLDLKTLLKLDENEHD